MTRSDVGLLVGAILGLALIIGGFGEMLIVGVAAGLGWLVAQVLQGEVDLDDWAGRNRRTGPDQAGRR